MINVDALIDAVKQQMQPTHRAQHLAQILQQLFAVMPDEATLADLVTGWQCLSRPQNQE